MGHQFHDEECEMYDPEFLNTSQGPAKTSKGRQAPGVKGPFQDHRDEGNSLRAAPLESDDRK